MADRAGTEGIDCLPVAMLAPARAPAAPDTGKSSWYLNGEVGHRPPRRVRSAGFRPRRGSTRHQVQPANRRGRPPDPSSDPVRSFQAPPASGRGVSEFTGAGEAGRPGPDHRHPRPGPELPGRVLSCVPSRLRLPLDPVNRGRNPSPWLPRQGDPADRFRPASS